MSFGVTQQMIAAFGDTIFELSLNKQHRRGDPVRELDWDGIEAMREGMGLSDEQIAARIGLAPEQVRFIRVVMERRRFRTDQYRKLFTLGGGKRWRAERYRDAREARHYREDAMTLREAMTFDPAEVKKFVDNGWWTDETLGGNLAAHAENRPDKPAIVAGDTRITYGELAGKASRFAGGLGALGVGPGDVVAVQLPNVPEFIIGNYAIAALGAVMATIHMPYREAELRALLRHSGARAVLCLAAFRDYPTAEVMLRLKDEIDTLEHVIALGPPVDGALPIVSLIDGGTPAPLEGVAVGADPFLMLFTSGTTAAPKAVPLSYQTMLSNTRLGIPEHEVGPDDVYLSAAPLSHLFGLYSFHLTALTGATNLLLPAFAPPELAALIERGRPTVLFVAPAHIAACTQAGLFDKNDLSSVRLAITAGSPVSRSLAHGFQDRLSQGSCLTQLWGMTELQAGLFSRPRQGIEVSSRSAGPPPPGNEARIADENGNALPPGEEGELQVRGCSLFPGYYNNPEATAAAFTPDGWFHSGDLAVMDAAGNVSITGRLKDVINRGGIKYNPLDVELLLDAHPKVMQSAIVPMRDAVLGEKACAFAVLAEGAETSLEELCSYLVEKGIAKLKLPERLEIVPEMPLTPTRKVIKGRLAALLNDG